MKKQSKPKFYIRPDDYEIFSLNDDKETYSVDALKKRWPMNFHFQYQEQVLLARGFFVAEEYDLHFYRKKHEEHYSTLKRYGGCGDDE